LEASDCAAIRASVVDHLQEALGGENDPLAIALSIAADVKQPVEIRLGACGLAIPVMYPRLSAATVQANHTVTNIINAGDLMDRLADRIAKLTAPATTTHQLDEPDEIEDPPEIVGERGQAEFGSQWQLVYLSARLAYRQG
jgi:hypothetical protein